MPSDESIEFDAQVNEMLDESARAGIRSVGGPAALDAALKLFVTHTTELWTVIKIAQNWAEQNNQPAILPLTENVMEVHMKSVMSGALVCKLMELGALEN